MRTEHICIDYRLKFTTAFHLGTGLRGGIVHRLVARDADGFLYVPGSTLKGALRDHCEQLARLFKIQTTSPHQASLTEASPDVDIVSLIFGNRFHPGQIYFDDAQMIQEDRELFKVEGIHADEFRAWQTEYRTQVSLSRLTRTAHPGLLYTSEHGVRNLRFEGRFVGMMEGTPLPDSGVGTYPLLLLVAGLLSLEHLGSNKSAGAGKVRCEIDEQRVCIGGHPLPITALLEQLPYLDRDFYEQWREEEQE